jgi:hypothetical protein
VRLSLFDLGGAFGEISRDSDDPRSLLPPKKLVPNDAPNHSKNSSPIAEAFNGSTALSFRKQKPRATFQRLLVVAAIEKFLSAAWDVVGVSRRKPELPSGRMLSFCRSICGTKKRARAAFFLVSG